MALLFAWLAMFGPFSIDPIFPAFSQLSRSPAVDQVAIQQTISVHLLAYGLMSIAHGPLSDVWGRADDPGRAGVVHRWLDRVCAVARLAQVAGVPRAAGLSAGVGMIVGRAMIRDLFNGPDAQRLMRHVSMIFGIAPAIAPIIGGWILLSGAGWPLIFRFLVVFGLVLLVATIHAASEAGRRRLRLAMHSCHRRHDPGCVLVRVHGADAADPHRLHLLRVAALVDLAYTFAVAQIALPWAVLAIFLTGLGMALIFPILALADMYPQQRGLASLQAFTQLMTNTVVAGCCRRC